MKDNQFTFNWTTTFYYWQRGKVDCGSRTLGPYVFIASNVIVVSGKRSWFPENVTLKDDDWLGMNLIAINLRLEGIISPHMYTVLKKKIKRYYIVLWVTFL